MSGLSLTTSAISMGGDLASEKTTGGALFTLRPISWNCWRKTRAYARSASSGKSMEKTHVTRSQLLGIAGSLPGTMYTLSVLRQGSRAPFAVDGL